MDQSSPGTKAPLVISVFGMGYVGVVSAACFAKLGYKVIGVDVSEGKVALINKGEAPIVEEDTSEMIAEAVEKGLLSATGDAEAAASGADILIVCVGTPSKPNGSLDNQYIVKVTEQIGETLRGRNRPCTVVFRSTMLPGTMNSLVIPLLEKSAGKAVGDGYEVLFHPEFLRESSAVWDFFNPPKIVVGEKRSGSAKTLLDIYPASIEAPRIVCPIEEAEMVKYCDNMFHAVKVTFANEVGMFCRTQGINSQHVMDIFCQDRKLNISDKYLKPGFAFGGSCLPKDLRAFLYASRAMELRTPFIAGILESNDEQISRVFNYLLRQQTRNMGFYGLSFKPGTDDLRESPLVTLAEHLNGKGISLRIYDDKVRISQLIGGNKAYINERLPHLAQQLVDSVEDLEGCDVVILGHSMDEKSVRARFLDKGVKVLDLNPCKTPIQHPAYFNIAS